jgi:hypothetical protein
MAEAQVALTKLQRQIDQQQHPKSAITVREAVQQWLEVADLEVTTRERYEDLIRLYLVPRLVTSRRASSTPRSSSASTLACTSAETCAVASPRKATPAGR